MCERSVCSIYCLAELRVAKKYGIPIIPVHCFPVSGLEETIIKLQRYMDNNEQVEISDSLISEILKTKNGSEMISIPYDTPAHLREILKSLEGNGADGVIAKAETEYCAACGTAYNPDEDRFCINCGYDLSPTKEE
jgi:hypothetical protein